MTIPNQLSTQEKETRERVITYHKMKHMNVNAMRPRNDAKASKRNLSTAVGISYPQLKHM